MATTRQRFRRLTISVLVSLLAGYLALRGVHLQQAFSEVLGARMSLVALAFLLCVAGQVGRSLRWALLLEPLEPVDQRLLLPITSIGFLFIWILPARLGEMARPYLLQQNSKVGFSAAAGSVVFERMLDFAFLVIALLVCLPALPPQDWLTLSLRGFVFLFLAVILFLILGSLPWSRNQFLRLAFRILPDSLSQALSRTVETFYGGMKAIASLRRMVAVLGMTLFVWGCGIFAKGLLFKAMGLELGWLAATTVLVLASLGIALPAAPGFIGSFHYATVLALTLFGLVKDKALAFAILDHLVIVITVVAMGVFFMNVSRLRVSSPWKREVLSGEN